MTKVNKMTTIRIFFPAIPPSLAEQNKFNPPFCRFRPSRIRLLSKLRTHPGYRDTMQAASHQQLHDPVTIRQPNILARNMITDDGIKFLLKFCPVAPMSITTPGSFSTARGKFASAEGKER